MATLFGILAIVTFLQGDQSCILFFILWLVFRKK